MRAQTIAQLAWYIPRANASGMSAVEDASGIQGISVDQANDIIHYANCHKNLKFGWDFAKTLAQEDVPFPALLHGDDLVIWRAYRFIKGGGSDAVIEGAVAIEHLPEWKTLRGQIRSLLVAREVDCAFVATKFGMRLDVVKAYEKLFFNVLDRKEDHIWLANIIFPEGRISEAFEDYLQKSSIDDLMLRAGYSKGVQHVLYATGLGQHPYAGLDAATGAADLDAMFMADGCLYAGFGWMHQSKNAMPIMNARLSMQAGKMGGESTVNADALGIGDAMANELVNISEIKARAKATSAVLDVIPSIPSNIQQSKA